MKSAKIYSRKLKAFFGHQNEFLCNRHESLKYLPDKISPRQNFFPPKFLPAQISSRQIFLLGNYLQIVKRHLILTLQCVKILNTNHFHFVNKKLSLQPKTTNVNESGLSFLKILQYYLSFLSFVLFTAHIHINNVSNIM